MDGWMDGWMDDALQQGDPDHLPLVRHREGLTVSSTSAEHTIFAVEVHILDTLIDMLTLLNSVAVAELHADRYI
jgi:hypothetical protein